MKAIERAIQLLFDLNGYTTAPALAEQIPGIVSEARTELEMLKKAGITVTKKETYVVEGPARKRGRKSKA